MCNHMFFYHDRHPLQRHRPVWQCGTCGRQEAREVLITWETEWRR
jgi:hypothetical protein